MPENQPHIFILHGDDQVAIHHFIRAREAKLGDADMAEMSISRLDGRTVNESDLRNAAMAASFFSSERLVVLTNPLAKIDTKRGAGAEDESDQAGSSKQKSAKTNFLKFLEDVPETTVLILVIEDQQKWRAGSASWEVLGEKHFLPKWAGEHAEVAQVVGLPLPSEREMPGWVQKKVREMGGKISLEAASELAGYVGNDTRLAGLEIDKLITYTNGRQIEVDDVMTISTSIASATIWNLTDAIGERDARKALAVLHQLMETLDIRQEIFPMIIWLFRQLLLGREVLDEGGGVPELMRELHVADFQARKLAGQVQRFKLSQLRLAYRQIMAIEEESKRGSSDLSVLLDQLIIQLASPTR
jgi:DNA polymerase III subunit delta